MGPVKTKKEAVGFDLGLRELASFSDPDMPAVEAKKFYGNLEEKLALAQSPRARKIGRAQLDASPLPLHHAHYREQSLGNQPRSSQSKSKAHALRAVSQLNGCE